MRSPYHTTELPSQFQSLTGLILLSVEWAVTPDLKAMEECHVAIGYNLQNKSPEWRVDVCSRFIAASNSCHSVGDLQILTS